MQPTGSTAATGQGRSGTPAPDRAEIERQIVALEEERPTPFLRHAAICTSQYDAQYRSMAREILWLRDMVAAGLPVVPAQADAPPDPDDAVDPHVASPGTLTTRVQMRSDVFVYLAGPISAKDGYTVEANVAAALAVFLTCIARGIPAFCPQLTGAFPSAHADVGYETWLAYDRMVIDRCTHLFLLDRWETSAGAVREKAYAERIGLPILLSLDEV